MSQAPWVKIANAVRESVVLIETPSVRGTGFVVQPPPGTRHQTVVTAHHVINHALDWREPIKITHFPSKKQAFLDINARIITPNAARDMALIQFSADELPLPPSKIPMLKEKTRLYEGVQTGWLGFPAVAPFNLCFFTGHISAWIESEEAYLVDGVAINGVSGGPAFYEDESGKICIIGIVTEYRPNFATGNVLPGVSLIRSTGPVMDFYAALQKQIEAAKVQEIPTGQIHGGLPTSLK